MSEEWFRLGGSRLSVGLSCAPGFAVATWEGTADDSALTTILEAGIRLLESAGDAVVMDLRGLEGTAARGGEALVRLIREAQRLDREVRIVGCGEALERRLRAVGLRGEFWHYPSLIAATEGAAAETGHTLTVHLRRERATRARLRLLVASLARPCALDEDDQARFVVALDDVCSLAVATKGREDGPLTLCFFAREATLTVDVSWQVSAPVLREADAVWERRPKARARLMAALDTVETLAQTDGIVVRLSRRTRGVSPTAGAAPAAPLRSPEDRQREGATVPAASLAAGTPVGRLPDSAEKRGTGAAAGGAVSRWKGRGAWREWIRRPHFAFVAGLAGRGAGSGRSVTGERKDGKGK